MQILMVVIKNAINFSIYVIHLTVYEQFEASLLYLIS